MRSSIASFSMVTTLLTSALAVTACGSTPSGENSDSTSSDILRPGPPIRLCGLIGMSPCSSGSACIANASAPQGTCECNWGFLDSSGACAVDKSTYYATEITDYFFGSNPVAGVLDQFGLQITNNQMTVTVPDVQGLTAPASSTIAAISGSKSGVSYSATIPSLALNNWDWSASDGINLAATFNGTIDINLSYGFSCTTQAYLTNVPVNVAFQLFNGTTTVTSTSVNVLDNNNIRFSSGCTIGNIIGTTTLASTIQGALQSQLQTQFSNMFNGPELLAWCTLMSDVANDGILTCTSGCDAATLGAPGPGWQWSCTAVDTTPAGITGTCHRQ